MNHHYPLGGGVSPTSSKRWLWPRWTREAPRRHTRSCQCNIARRPLESYRDLQMLMNLRMGLRCHVMYIVVYDFLIQVFEFNTFYQDLSSMNTWLRIDNVATSIIFDNISRVCSSNTCTHTDTHTHAHNTYRWIMYIYIYIFIYLYIYLHTYLYIYMHIHGM